MQNLIFKEITSKEELESFFKFRYDIYLKSDNKIFLNENEHKLDIDYFDLRARHYSITGGENKAGYLRVVLPFNDYNNSDAMEIGKTYNLVSEEEHCDDGKAPYPFLSYNGVPQSHWDFYNDLKRQNKKVVEASRFMIHPDFRSLRTAIFLMECTIALYIRSFDYLDHTVANCCIEHGPIYKRFGFNEVAGNGKFNVNGLNKMSLTMPVSLSAVPEKLQEKFLNMSEQFINFKKIEREL